nr:MAG: SDR family oxidoreductase [Bacteroidota bacterium]
MELNGKVAWVTGASRGLGRAFSEALLERGARVAGMARSRSELEEMARRWGEHFLPVLGDVRRPEDVERAVEQIRARWGTIHVLINNAGLGRFGNVEELSLEDWQVQIETNLTGVFLCTRAAVPLMKAQRYGHIVNISSIAGLLGNPQLTAYNASKFGVRGFSEALMKELRDFGIKVTCVYPGSVDTPFFDPLGMPRHANMMRPEEVARTVVFILETSDNFLISEIVLRPLNPNPPAT